MIVLLCSITSLGVDEQVVVSGPTGKYVRNGPQTIILSPSREKEFRKAIKIHELEYAVIKNTFTGEIRHEEGPQGRLWMQAYDIKEAILPKVTLQERDYIRLIDTLTGYERIIRGPQTIVPAPLEEAPNGTEEAVVMGPKLAVLTLNKTTGKKKLYSGEFSFAPGPYEVILEVRVSTLIEERQYAVVKELDTGRIRHEAGPKLFQAGAYDHVVQVKDMLTLEKDQYVRLTNEMNGSERVVRGPRTFTPDPAEVYPEGVQRAKFLDKDTAVLVLDQITGQEELKKKAEGQHMGVYIPEAHEEIIKEEELVTVDQKSAVVVRDSLGNVKVYQGSDPGTRAFFLEPYHQIVEQTWSGYPKETIQPGQVQEGTKVKVKKIDMSYLTMFFKYEVRTSDNVRVNLEGVIGWRVVDVGKMITATGDPPGDIWFRCRSALIQGVSKSTLEQFFNDQTSITREAFQAATGDDFYVRRGVQVLKMDLTKYEYADASVAKIMEQITQEKTNKINRMTQAASEAEVAEAKLTAEILLEKQKTDLIQKKVENKRLEARLDGEAAGMTLLKAADSFIAGLNSTVDNATTRVELYRLHETLNSKNTDTKNLASGKAELYITPDNVNLKLMMPNAEARRLEHVEL